MLFRCIKIGIFINIKGKTITIETSNSLTLGIGTYCGRVASRSTTIPSVSEFDVSIVIVLPLILMKIPIFIHRNNIIKEDDEIYWMSGNLQKKHSLKLPMYLSMKKIETRFNLSSMLLCLDSWIQIPDAP
jgi:hypothetical protein